MLRAILRSPVAHNAFRHGSLRQTSIRTFRKMDSQGISGPLVWIDCEMTGLSPKKDKLLEIAVRSSFNRRLCPSLTSTQVLITNGELELVDEGICYVIRTEKEVLDQYVTICLRRGIVRKPEVGGTQDGRLVHQDTWTGSYFSFAMSIPRLNASQVWPDYCVY